MSDGTLHAVVPAHPSIQRRVAALAQERIHSTDQQQYWLNLILLLFAGADACDRAVREKVGKGWGGGWPPPVRGLQ